jgi:hypothetical protein
MATAPVPIGWKAVPIPPFPDKATTPPPPEADKKGLPIWPIVIALTAGALVVAALWRR